MYTSPSKLTRKLENISSHADQYVHEKGHSTSRAHMYGMLRTNLYADEYRTLHVPEVPKAAGILIFDSKLPAFPVERRGPTLQG